jgi:putative redox protein
LAVEWQTNPDREKEIHMPAKKVQVEIRQGQGFRTECRAGKHVVIIDQPAPAGGTDAGPTPLDVQLMALGGCVAAIGRIIANQRKLAVRGLEVSIEGDIDTDGLLGKASASRVGFSAITARVKIDADMSAAEKEQLLHDIDVRCPISENLQNATPVSMVLAQ